MQGVPTPGVLRKYVQAKELHKAVVRKCVKTKDGPKPREKEPGAARHTRRRKPSLLGKFTNLF
jgi:hypothetical protein